MTNPGATSRNLVAITVLAIVLIASFYLFATHSDAYEDAVFFAKSNIEIENSIGHVSKVSLDLWEGFEISESGRSGEANFVLKLQGDKCSGVLDIQMHKSAGVWRPYEALLSTDTTTKTSLDLPKNNT